MALENSSLRDVFGTPESFLPSRAVSGVSLRLVLSLSRGCFLSPQGNGADKPSRRWTGSAVS